MKWAKRGYTLIEVLVGITIIGLIFAVGYVNFRDFSRRQAINGQARALKGDLRLAQEKSLSGVKPADSRCDPPNKLNGYNFRVVNALNYVVEANCTGGNVLVKSVNLPSDVTISIPSPNPISFKILGQGTNIVDQSTINLTQAVTGYVRTVTVTKGGEIK